MIKIDVPPGTTRKVDTLTRPEVKINIPAELIVMTVFNKSQTAKVEIGIAGSLYTVTVSDHPSTEFKLEMPPDTLLSRLREKSPWDGAGYCFYCEAVDHHKPECLWVAIQ